MGEVSGIKHTVNGLRDGGGRDRPRGWYAASSSIA